MTAILFVKNCTDWYPSPITIEILREAFEMRQEAIWMESPFTEHTFKSPMILLKSTRGKGVRLPSRQVAAVPVQDLIRENIVPQLVAYPSSMTTEILREAFKVYIPIKRVTENIGDFLRLITRKSRWDNGNTRSALIYFKSMENAEAAKSHLDGKPLYGAYLEVSHDSKPPKSARGKGVSVPIEQVAAIQKFWLKETSFSHVCYIKQQFFHCKKKQFKSSGYGEKLLVIKLQLPPGSKM
ncbi:hypothetical protein DAPPUDRAFT_319715 [Daphnia pulex]|uniref:RRM domain-containing protein n=1 Tax=Daphnia pulex TaxID=6669 RepID=E9GMK7_DAPPU|nr:hypothetical protein DAPPUDRAFT_319715 [Daphnia pulex]|eukprot:EFX79115.1 hypothetical protein DAPPUDRAFT_319715 [Daphnia pulex]